MSLKIKFKNSNFLRKKVYILRRHRNVTMFLDWLRFVIEYGLLTNIMLTGILGLPFTPITVIAYGILWFFIKYELPRVKKEWSGE